MILPKDWDKPSPENEGLCKKFTYGVFEDQGRLSYRLFVPENKDRVPLIVYLHGADAFGNDNEAQLSMHDIGTCFSRPERQRKNPCFILAPQCQARDSWSVRSSGRRVCSLIKKLIQDEKNIDPDRVYIYGYSAGGIGTIRLVKEWPELFAAAVSICGATERDKMDVLMKIPLWLIHAEDDEIVRCYYRSDNPIKAIMGSAEIYETLKNKARDIHYLEYPAGFMKKQYGVNPHCTWVCAAEDEKMAEWLFSNYKSHS